MSKYHGRDMEGPSLRRFVERADEIFPEIEAMLLQSNREVSREEIIEMCNAYRILFTLMDGSFYIMRKPNRLLEQFLKYNGLGDLIEEFIEYQHKTTKDHQQRLGAIKDFQQQSNAISHLQHLENLPEVRAEKQKVAEASKRNHRGKIPRRTHQIKRRHRKSATRMKPLL